MDLRYRVNTADNIPPGRLFETRGEDGSCPVCGRRCSFLYVYSPNDSRRDSGYGRFAGYAVGCDRCVFVADA